MHTRTHSPIYLVNLLTLTHPTLNHLLARPLKVLPAICTLSFSQVNKIDIATNGGLPPCIALLECGDPDLEQLACCAIANLAEVRMTISRTRTQKRMHVLTHALFVSHTLTLLLTYSPRYPFIHSLTHRWWRTNFVSWRGVPSST